MNNVIAIFLFQLMTIKFSYLVEERVADGIGRLWLLIFPCCLIGFLIPENDYIGCMIWAFESIALIYDLKYMEINDFNHFIPLICLGLEIIKQTLRGEMKLDIWMFLPLLFTLATVRTRGASDTLALIVYCFYGLVTHKPYLQVLIAIFIGYLIQVIVTIIYAKIKKISIRESEYVRKPFLPALYVGSLALLV